MVAGGFVQLLVDILLLMLYDYIQKNMAAGGSVQILVDILLYDYIFYTKLQKNNIAAGSSVQTLVEINCTK